MSSVIKNMLSRRSIRQYKQDPIPEEVLARILNAGTYAPTGMNKQAPIIIAVTNREMRDRLSRMNAQIMGTPEKDPFYGAPTVLIVLADKSIRTHLEDGSLVMGNLMNAAFSVGVDSCWIHRAREEFDSEEGKALLKKWGIEGDYVGIGHLSLGYRDGALPETRARKDNYIYYV